MDEKTITFIGLAITFVLGAVNLGITFWNSWRGQGKDKAGETDINAQNVKTIFDLQREFVEYKQQTDERMKQMEHTIDYLKRENAALERWARRLVVQLEQNHIVPVPFEDEGEVE